MGMAEGGDVENFPRRTGEISGPGTKTSDSIPAMQSDGEFVQRADAVNGAGVMMGAKNAQEAREKGADFMYALQSKLESVRKQYEEFAGTPKTAEQFAQEYDALTPTDTTPEENFGFEKNLALIRLGLGLMQPTPGGAIMPALSKAGENFLGDLAAINERKRKAKADRAEQESEEDRARREYILKAMQEQNDMRSANEFEMFMKVLQINIYCTLIISSIRNKSFFSVLLCC